MIFSKSHIMKHTLFLCLLLCSTAVNAQYEAAMRYLDPSIPFTVAADTLIARAGAAPADTNEGGDVNALTRWKYFMGGRICNDVSPGGDMYAPLSMALSHYMGSSGPCIGGGSWSCLGPFTSSYGRVSKSALDGGEAYQGRINSLWVSPYDTSIILAGADAGGVWRTDDGGQHWRNISDGNTVPGTMGISDIAVDPLDTGIIYVALSSISNQYTKSYGYNLGIAYSGNSGASWQPDTAFNILVNGGLTPPDKVKIAYMPGTEHLFALYRNRVLYKDNPAAAWQDISPGCFSSRKKCFYIDFTKQTPIRAAIGVTALSAGGVDSSALWLYDPSGGGSWTNLQLVIPPYLGTPYRQPNDDYGPFMFSISSDDTAFIEMKARNAGLTSDVYLLMNTSLSSVSLNMINPAFDNNVEQFVVSPANSNVMYLTYKGLRGVGLLKSVNRGESNDIQYLSHTDGRCVYIQHTDIDDKHDVVYFGTDGGVNKKRYEDSGIVAIPHLAINTHCMSITGEGLAITEFYGFGNTDANENIMAGGAQDNGGYTYIKDRPEPWRNETAYAPGATGGDGYESKMMRNGINVAIGEVNSTARPFPLYSTQFTGTTVHDTAINNPYSESNILSRPLYFDARNEAYVGYQHVWKLPYGDTGWVLAHPIHTEPIDVGANINNTVGDFYIDERDSDNVYIVYYAEAGTDPTPFAGFSAGKLFHSHNATNKPPLPPPSWTNITPRQVQWDRINSIAVDPNNNGRIWVALGNIDTAIVNLSPSSMLHRVYYSNDSGNTWSNLSKGLSALPVNKLLYRKGSNDELYAGTDVGVFKWNPATSNWDCFNNGLPTCIVMDMEVNNCAGKLRVATYGRGMWETRLGDNILPAPNNVIRTNTTWSGQHQYVDGGIDIQAGATLTISSNDTVHMPKNGLIIVEPGGKLVVDHAIIENSCDYCMWGGIQARGNSFTNQTPATQGWVTIKNGSTIRDALKAVSNCNTDPAYFYGTTGGVIQANNSYFIDNTNCATFYVYDNEDPTTHVVSDNLSYFYGCTFMLDDHFKGHYGPGMNSMVYLSGVEGVKFMADEFVNRDSRHARMGEGIRSHKSGFEVSGICSGALIGGVCSVPMTPTRFCGFSNGVYIENGTSFCPTISIDNGLFDSASIGVNCVATNNTSISNSTFVVGHGNGVVVSDSFAGCAQNIGIFMQNTNQFVMEDNTFTGKPNHTSLSSVWNNFGTIVANSGVQDNVVYRNTFGDSLNYGVYAVGANSLDRTLTVSGGLLVSCNSFSKNFVDLRIAKDSGYSATQGINLQQRPGGHTAQNSFACSSYNIVNYGWLINYYWDGHSIPYPCPTSTTYPPSRIPTVNVNIILGSSNDCLSNFGGYSPSIPYFSGSASRAVDPSALRAYKADFNSSKTLYTSKLALYKSQIDYGNTDSLITVIDTSANAAGLYSMLSAKAPYLSAGVVKAAADMHVLSYSQMFNVMFQNPDNLNDSEYIVYVNADYGFTPADYSTLLAAAYTTTDRTDLKNLIDGKHMDMSRDANIIIMALKSCSDSSVSTFDTTGADICMDSTSIYYRLDSNSHYWGLDSLDTWLQNIGGLWTNYERAAYYDSRGHHDIADSIFGGISAVLPSEAINPTEWTTYRSIKAVRDVIRGAEADGRDMYRLTDDEIASLDAPDTAGITYNTGALMAYSLAHQGESVRASDGGPCLVRIPAPYPSSRMGHEGGTAPSLPPIKDINGINDANEFTVFPNPTSGMVTFTYNIPDGGNKLQITVTNVVGEKVASIYANSSAGSVNWDPGRMPAGIYIYTASNDRGVIRKGKLVVVR
jgi:hypothetical protein